MWIIPPEEDSKTTLTDNNKRLVDLAKELGGLLKKTKIPNTENTENTENLEEITYSQTGNTTPQTPNIYPYSPKGYFGLN